MDHGSTCDYCGGNGIVPVYHRDYTGKTTMRVELVDRWGEVHHRRVSGVIAAHCVCPKGRWMRDMVRDEDRRRIPSLQAVLERRTAYVLDDPTADDDPVVTESAARFIRAWKSGLSVFAGRLAADDASRYDPSEQAHAAIDVIRQRVEAAEAVECPF